MYILYIENTEFKSAYDNTIRPITASNLVMMLQNYCSSRKSTLKLHRRTPTKCWRSAYFCWKYQWSKKHLVS